MMFALATTALVLAAGGAVDYTAMQSERSKAQNALDSATLHAARIRLTSNNTPLHELVTTAFNLNFPGEDIGPQDVKVKLVGESLQASFSGSSQTKLLGAVGFDNFDYTVNSVVSVGNQDLEIALVIDSTASLRNNGHEQTVINGLTNLVTNLETAKAKIAFVPFSTTVNLGTNWQNDWIDFAGNSSFHGILFDESAGPVRHMDLFSNLGSTWDNCVEMRPYPLDTTDIPPSNLDADTQWVPYIAPSITPYSEYLITGHDQTDVHPQTGWTAQVARDPAVYQAANHASNTDHTGNGGIYDANSNCNPNRIVPLTEVHSQIQSAISGLIFEGGTNIPSGLVWGWRTLSPSVPFTEGAAYDDNITAKALILFTDGLNDIGGAEANAYGAYYDQRLATETFPWNSGLSQILDQRMLETCENIKDQDITLFVVSYDLPNTAQSDLFRGKLDQCATDPNLHYKAENSGDLKSAFDEITKRTVELRIMQ